MSSEVYALQFHVYDVSPFGHINFSLTDEKGNVVSFGGNRDGWAASVVDETSKYYYGHESDRVDSRTILIDSATYNKIINFTNNLSEVHKEPYVPLPFGVDLSNGWNCVEFAQSIYDLASGTGGSVLTSFSEHDMSEIPRGISLSMVMLAHKEFFESGEYQRLFSDSGYNYTPIPSWADPTPSFSELMRLTQEHYASANGSFSSADPLIFDLNGDGVQTTSLTDSKAFFDVDGDGFAERTEGASGNDGMLVIDANENGLVNDVSERFGDDTAANGITDSGELKTLTD